MNVIAAPDGALHRLAALTIAGLGDRLAPPQQAEILWRHWDRCAFHWFPGNHVLHVSQPDYLRRMTRFLGPYMFD